MTKYAIASILAIQNKFEDAEALLQVISPRTKTDWFGLHIYGMILLLKGLVSEATDVFQYGLNNSPYHEAKMMFARSSSAADIRVGAFEQAIRRLQDLRDPISIFIRWEL